MVKIDAEGVMVAAMQRLVIWTCHLCFEPAVSVREQVAEKRIGRAVLVDLICAGRKRLSLDRRGSAKAAPFCRCRGLCEVFSAIC